MDEWHLDGTYNLVTLTWDGGNGNWGTPNWSGEVGTDFQIWYSDQCLEGIEGVCDLG